jgi:hypothetical protein
MKIQDNEKFIVLVDRINELRAKFLQFIDKHFFNYLILQEYRNKIIDEFTTKIKKHQEAFDHYNELLNVLNEMANPAQLFSEDPEMRTLTDEINKIKEKLNDPSFDESDREAYQAILETKISLCEQRQKILRDNQAALEKDKANHLLCKMKIQNEKVNCKYEISILNNKLEAFNHFLYQEKTENFSDKLKDIALLMDYYDVYCGKGANRGIGFTYKEVTLEESYSPGTGGFAVAAVHHYAGLERDEPMVKLIQSVIDSYTNLSSLVASVEKLNFSTRTRDLNSFKNFMNELEQNILKIKEPSKENIIFDKKAHDVVLNITNTLIRGYYKEKSLSSFLNSLSSRLWNQFMTEHHQIGDDISDDEKKFIFSILENSFILTPDACNAFILLLHETYQKVHKSLINTDEDEANMLIKMSIISDETSIKNQIKSFGDGLSNIKKIISAEECFQDQRNYGVDFSCVTNAYYQASDAFDQLYNDLITQEQSRYSP